MMTMANIAFLGTGLLGGAFAEACAKRGDTVVAWNRSADKVLALRQFGVKAAATPAEAVKGASRVHFVLKDDAVVEEVIAAARAAFMTPQHARNAQGSMLASGPAALFERVRAEL